ncbi:MAG: hypothetical protein JHC93_04095, partial [Parachlamydiales bacterium]|nr:hypothetical protein [Parachlamydiales bacterium]
LKIIKEKFSHYFRENAKDIFSVFLISTSSLATSSAFLILCEVSIPVVIAITSTIVLFCLLLPMLFMIGSAIKSVITDALKTFNQESVENQKKIWLKEVLVICNTSRFAKLFPVCKDVEKYIIEKNHSFWPKPKFEATVLFKDPYDAEKYLLKKNYIGPITEREEMEKIEANKCGNFISLRIKSQTNHSKIYKSSVFSKFAISQLLSQRQ